jgi:SagB-type dehydrogenase family enzyme
MLKHDSAGSSGGVELCTAYEYEQIVADRSLVSLSPLLQRNLRDSGRRPKPFVSSSYSPTLIPLCAGVRTDGLRLGTPRTLSFYHCDALLKLSEVSDLLLLSGGLLKRRLSLTWSSEGKSAYPSAHYSRGVASGGGIYPVGVYLVQQTLLDLSPGIYSYSPAQHSLQKVRAGRFQSIVAKYLDFPDAEFADAIFVLTGRFWQSAFKYRKFVTRWDGRRQSFIGSMIDESVRYWD